MDAVNKLWKRVNVAAQMIFHLSNAGSSPLIYMFSRAPRKWKKEFSLYTNNNDIRKMNTKNFFLIVCLNFFSIQFREYTHNVDFVC